MTAERPPPPPETTDDGSRGMGRGKVALLACLVGFVLAVVLLTLLAGNPLGTANEVRYTDVVVGPVSQESDELCWSESADDSAASRSCAILALDPREPVPEEGDEVTLGVVDISAPGGQQQTQIVFAAPADATGSSPTAGAGGS